MQVRILNFLNNGSTQYYPRLARPGDASTMQYRFLTDAVAAGFPLDEINEEWEQAEIEIREAFNRQRSDQPESWTAVKLHLVAVFRKPKQTDHPPGASLTTTR